MKVEIVRNSQASAECCDLCLRNFAYLENEARLVNGTMVCLRCYPLAVDVALADERAGIDTGESKA